MKEYLFFSEVYPYIEVTIHAHSEEAAFDKLEVMFEANEFWINFVRMPHWELASTAY